jgi:hypothetical protein
MFTAANLPSQLHSPWQENALRADCVDLTGGEREERESRQLKGYKKELQGSRAVALKAACSE